MRNPYLMVFLIVAFLIVATAGRGIEAESAVAAAPAEKTLILHQYSNLNGKSVLKVGPKGVRLSFPLRRLVFLVCAPDWNVQFLNEQSKMYCRCPAPTWRSPMASTAAMFRPGDPSTLKPVSSEMVVLRKLACKKYQLLQPGSGEQGAKSWQRLLVRSGELYVLENKTYPKNVSVVLSRTLGTITSVEGIPISFTAVNNNGSHNEELKLEEQNEGPYQPAEFLVPKDYKLVASPNEVLGNDGANEGLSEFIR